MQIPVRLTDFVRERTTAVAISGVATAVITAGTVSAAALASTAQGHPVRSAHVASAAAKHKTKPAARPATRPATRPAAPAAPPTWDQIQQAVARQTSPSEPPAASTLQPVGTSGPQASMPISGDQMANATAIVKQALAKRMGVRSAVIAVATSMQESRLQNISYGTSDSLGLFQQRASMGWGTAQQILDPQHAASAFLTALQQYQAGNPGWATQPLWASAQAVQKSGAPLAYAKWEAQAAKLVQQVVTQIS